MRTCAERGDWGIVGSEARAVHDDQVGLACQVRLGLLEPERVGECGIARCPDHFHGMMADNYIATILLHATSFADNELGQSGIVQSTFAGFENVCISYGHAILQFVRHFVVGRGPEVFSDIVLLGRQRVRRVARLQTLDGFSSAVLTGGRPSNFGEPVKRL